MRVSLKWLADYVDLRVPPEELARRLTASTVEVEEIVRRGGWEGVEVGLVVDVQPHPNADRLRLATVETGDGRHTVVCGAPNVAPGQKVAFARVGARLTDPHTGGPMTLRAAKIRGVESAGMVCSERELGLSDEHEGILVLPEDAPVGTPLDAYLGDTILDLAAWPNRPDLMSMLGVAWEVAALTGAAVREPDPAYPEEGGPAADLASVEIQDPDLCARYVAGVVEEVQVGPSPAWLQERLLAAGMRPINNVVDITNYVMLEYGQPLHAFDYDKLREHAIIVRRAREGERLTTLDGVDRTLTPEMLVIADPAGPVALAGVMGGAETEVSPATRRVLLESASFHGPAIRRTSARLGLRSEASARFEKGVSPELPPLAARRAVQLMVELCGGRAAAGLVDVYPRPREVQTVSFTQERLRRVLGIDPPPPVVRDVLERLGFRVQHVQPDRYVVTVPPWRADVAIPEDVAEEFVRVHGYDSLPSTLLSGSLQPHVPEPLRDLRERVRDVMKDAGMQEVITYSLVSLDLLRAVVPSEDLAADPPLRVVNPVSLEHEYLRPTLRPSLLRTLAANLRVSDTALALFETARTYHRRGGGLPDEVETLAGVVAGRRPDRWGGPSDEPVDFFDAKGYVEHLFARLGVQAGYQPAEDHGLLPGRTARITVDGQAVGWLGQVHPEVLERFDVRGEAYLFEVDLRALLPHVGGVPAYRPVSRFPAVERDLAVVVEEAVPAERVRAVILDHRLVRDARIFDVYTGDQVPAGRKSLAFSVTYQSYEKTLSDEEVDRAQAEIVARLAREVGGTLRA